MNCHYCDKECKNKRSLSNHERLCKENPNRQEHPRGSLGKKGKNQYIKAKEMGLPKPKISEKTRKLISESSKNRRHAKETRKRISDSMKKAHEEKRAWNIGMSRWNNEPSYPEKFFIKVIENEFQNKNYIREYPIGIYSADFCWPHLKKIIEIDGDQHQRFEEYKERDKRKEKYLSSNGYKVLRIIWSEMFNDPKTKIKECYNFIHCP